MDFSRFFSRRNEHQIHISQHQVAKTKQKMPGRKTMLIIFPEELEFVFHNFEKLHMSRLIGHCHGSTSNPNKRIKSILTKHFFTASQIMQSYSLLIVNIPTGRMSRPHVTENITIGKSHHFLIAVTQKLN